MTRFEYSSELFNQVQFHPEAIQDDEYMSRQVTDFFKKVLLLWKKALIAEAEIGLETLKDDVNQSSSDFSDQATYEENISLHVRARDRERKLIQKIDEALVMIEHGDYGFCNECGIEIGYDRMVARPTATMCIDCKTASEIKERHTGYIAIDEE
jgi:DnaK suppressor protein